MDNIILIEIIKHSYHIFAFILGSVAALGEIATRHSDKPKMILRFFETYIYLAINGFAAVLTYEMTAFFDIKMGTIRLNDKPFLLAVATGLGAMAILRSSITVGPGENASQAGFAPILQKLLDWVEKCYDQQRATKNFPEIRKIMKGCRLTRVEKNLPFTCLHILGVSEEDAASIGQRVQKIASSEIDDDDVKCLNIGIALCEVTGVELLKTVVDGLKEEVEIKDDGDDGSYESKVAKLREIMKGLE